MISALAWIPKGGASNEPQYTNIPDSELESVAEKINMEDADIGPDDSQSTGDSEADSEPEEASVSASERALRAASLARRGSRVVGETSHGGSSIERALADLDMDHYDDSDEDPAMGVLGANPGMAALKHPEKDPYFEGARGGANDVDSDSDADSEAGALTLQENDHLILAVRNEDDVSHLEMWVYEPQDARGPANLFVHHSVLLPAFPLAVAWLDCDPRGGVAPGNYCAVASYEPGIELWDLDVVDAVEPVATLGGADYAAARDLEVEDIPFSGGKKKSKGKSKSKGVPEVAVRPGSHEDAVLGLSWNRLVRNVLASGSADETVKVWDVTTQQVTNTLKHHKDKVQAVAWNGAEASVLLTGGFDKRACLVDVRSPKSVQKWKLPADVEALAWNPSLPTSFVVSCEDGAVLCFDARQGAKSSPTFATKAHSRATCVVAFSPGVPNLLLTGSTDKKLKLWDVADPSAVALVASQDLSVGAVFSAGFCGDAPLLVAAGGAGGTVAVWDSAANDGVAALATQRSPDVLAAARAFYGEEAKE